MSEVTDSPAPFPNTPYSTVHWRLRYQRGPARLLKCVHCAENGIDKQALDWARMHDRDGEDVMDYMPLCRKCHIAYDKSGHRKSHTEETKALLSQKNRGYKHTPEAVEKIRAAARNPSPEARAKMAAGGRKGAEARRAADPAPAKRGGKGKPGTGTGRAPGNPGIGKTRAAQQRAKTHCAQGHELTPDNIYWRGPDKKNRQCKRCARERSAARYQAQKDASVRKAA